MIKNVINYNLNKYCVDNNYPVKFPNAPLDREFGSPYLELYYLDTEVSSKTLSGNHLINGMFQINIVIEKGSGTFLSEKIKSELKEIFKINSVIRYNDESVHIMNFREGGDIPAEAWYISTITVDYAEFNQID